LATEPYNPETVLMVGQFDDIDRAQAAVIELRAMEEGPSTIEMVDGKLLELVDSINPNQLKDIVPKPFPKLMLLVEFDNSNERQQKKLTKRAGKIFAKYASSLQTETDPEHQALLWKVRHSSAAVLAHSAGQAKAVPIIEDGIVPIARFKEYLDGVYELFARNHLQAAIWGHAGDANVHLQPYLDLSQVGDRQTAFRVIDEYYKFVISLGGSTSGEHNDGRLRAPYLEMLYGPEVYDLFKKVKQIFDPYNTLNPGVKIDVTLDDIKPLVRHEYSMDHLYDHMPRS
jgi:FAD/FMN-containing dehydrogenase